MSVLIIIGFLKCRSTASCVLSCEKALPNGDVVMREICCMNAYADIATHTLLHPPLLL